MLFWIDLFPCCFLLDEGEGGLFGLKKKSSLYFSVFVFAVICFGVFFGGGGVDSC